MDGLKTDVENDDTLWPLLTNRKGRKEEEEEVDGFDVTIKISFFVSYHM